ncbi:patatin-like phospholipase family protein [Candidatus Latescibacterota bacterium]
MKIILISLVCIVVSFQAFAAETFSISYKNGRVVRNYPENSRPVIGLALSGGGARGIAHVGVIEVLEQNGIKIDRVAGSSMGSIIGGLYAAGYGTHALENIFQTFDWSDYFSNTPRRRSIYVTEKETHQWPLFDLRFHGLRARIPSSLSSGHKIISILSWLTLLPTFESGGDFDLLPVPFRAVATDLNTGDKIVLGSGNLGRAIQASSTVPLLFTPVEWEGRLLVDGGLKDNLPVGVAQEMGSDFVIAVEIQESMHPPEDLDNALNTADQATSILMRSITGISKELADFVISPDMEKFSSGNFNNIQGLVEQGRIAAKQALPSLKMKLEEKKREYGSVFVKTITVSPQKYRMQALEILQKYIDPNTDNNLAHISEAIEELWAAGHYMVIRAEIDETSGSLHVELTGIPETVTLVVQGKSGEGGNIETYETISLPDGFNSFGSLNASVDSLLHIIQSEGYSFAAIKDFRYNDSFDSLAVIIDVPRLTGISLDENLKTRDSVISREFDFKNGDILDLNKLMGSIESLYGTNLYEWLYADITPERGGAAIHVHFKEKDWSVMRLGLRFDETNSAAGQIAVSRENILGFGNEFTAVGHSGKRKKFIMLESQIDRIYKSLYTFNIKTYRLFRKRELYMDHADAIEYEDDRYGTVISLGQQMGKLGNVMFRFKSETLWTHFAPSTNMKNQNKEIRSIIMNSVIDTFDSYPFPKNGNISIIYIESSQEFFGGTEQFVKLFWSGSYAKTYAKKHTLLGGFSLGTADPSTPDIESFTLGGTATRLNCYDYDSAMSHFYADFQGLYHEEKFGNYMAVGKLKYRLFIPRYFHLGLIYNIGNVWNNQDTIRFDSLLQSYGIQGTFASRLGPFSIGWGITSQGDDRLYTSAGWEF